MAHSTSSLPAKRTKLHLPALFAKETQLFGWQGLSLTLPANWNLTSFGGDATAGHVRIDDEDGPRLELRWEQPKITVDVERSIAQFLARLERAAKKKRQRFEAADHPHIVAKSRKRKAQLVNYGWSGDSAESINAQGWGVAWHCADCKRVVVAHVIGRGHEPAAKAQRLASEVLSSLECHGHGGWQTWSFFELQIEVPEEFALGTAKLMTGRIEIEWQRVLKRGFPFNHMPAPQHRERIGLRRLAAANVLLESETLEDWANRVVGRGHQRYALGPAEPLAVHGHAAFVLRGAPRDWRRRIIVWVGDLLSRRRTPAVEARVWHCAESNKIFVLENELTLADEHVAQDALDSLKCH